MLVERTCNRGITACQKVLKDKKLLLFQKLLAGSGCPDLGQATRSGRSQRPFCGDLVWEAKDHDDLRESGVNKAHTAIDALEVHAVMIWSFLRTL